MSETEFAGSMEVDIESSQRRSNAERRAATRSAVLDAAIQAIVRYGYVGATSTRIAELSGFTRGAQKHHFKDKAAMMVEALVHLHENLLRQVMQELEHASQDGVRALLRALWHSFQSDLFTAATELRVAARIDDELRTVLIAAERQIGHRIRRFVTEALDNGRHTPERLAEVADHVVNLLRGMAFQRSLSPNEERELRQLRVLDEVVGALLAADDSDSG